MNYYAAPMEGLTDRIWRQVHQKWFGAADAPTRYYAPFLSPPENRVLIPKKMAELAPEANAGTVVIPQLLARDGELAAWMIGEVRKLGYMEINLNFGCPSGTVTAKGKGAGMLRDPARLDAFLDAVFSAVEGPVSVRPASASRAGGVCGSAGYLQSLSHLRADHPSPRDEAAVPGRGRPCRLCCGAAGVPDAGLLQRRCHDAGTLHALEAEFPQLSGSWWGGGSCRPGPVPPRAGRRTGFQRGTARLLR